jgi:hypothetical protein
MPIKVYTKNVDEHGSFQSQSRLDTEENKIKLKGEGKSVEIEFRTLSDIDLFQGQIEILRRNGTFSKH